MKWFHTHKFGPIQADGYQYCLTCNFAQEPGHQCKFVVFSTIVETSRITNSQVATVYVNRCSVCGQIVTKRVDVGH